MLLYPYEEDPGLLSGGGSPAPAARPGGPGFLTRLGSGLGQVFAGPDDPTLTTQQNAAARKQALMYAGLTTIAAGGQGMRGLQAVATGALQGQAAGASARTLQTKRDLQARIMQELQGSPDGPNLPMLRRMFVEAVARGDTDATSALSEIIKTMEAAANREGPRLMSVPGADGATLLVNPSTGETVRTIQGDPDYVDKDLGDRIVTYVRGHPERIIAIQRKGAAPGSDQTTLSAPQPYTDPTTGKTTLMAWDGRNRRLVPVGGALPPAPAVQGEDARKAAGFLSMLPEPLSFIDNFAGTPGRLQEAATQRGLREFTGADQQQLNLAGNMMAEAWLRMTTGAAYTEGELRNAQGMFIPQPGDRRETLAMKARNRRGLISMLRARAGLTGATDATAGGAGATGATGAAGAGGANRSLDALKPDMRSAVERLIADARAAGHNLSVRETARTQARQDSLYAQGPDTTRTRNSRHTVGEAADFDGNQAAIQWMRANAARYGLQTIGDWDPGHVQLSRGGAGVARQGGSLLESMGGLQLPGGAPAPAPAAPARPTRPGRVMGLDPKIFIHGGTH